MKILPWDRVNLITWASHEDMLNPVIPALRRLEEDGAFLGTELNIYTVSGPRRVAFGVPGAVPPSSPGSRVARTGSRSAEDSRTSFFCWWFSDKCRRAAWGAWNVHQTRHGGEWEGKEKGIVGQLSCLIRRRDLMPAPGNARACLSASVCLAFRCIRPMARLVPCTASSSSYLPPGWSSRARSSRGDRLTRHAPSLAQAL